MSIALVMILAGALSMIVLPIAQYPPPVPPQVQGTTQYMGADADLILVDGNPLENLDLVADPDKNFVVILKDGVIHKNQL